MTVTIEKIPRPELNELLSAKIGPNLTIDEMKKFNRALQASTIVWRGSKNGRTMCIWGLIPPTLMESTAHMWLHVIEPIEEFEFVLVRYSQKAIAKALEEFPEIVGLCAVGEDRAIRWIKWLGGKFGHPADGFVPFSIKAKEA